MKKLVLLLLLLQASFALQVIGHDQFNEATQEPTLLWIHQMGLDWAKPILVPVSGWFRHVFIDCFVSEGDLGEFQVVRGGIKLQTVLYTYPTEEYADHFWIAFNSVFPDLWDKGLNRNDFHSITGKPIFSFTRDSEETFEDILVVNRVWKVVAPKGTLLSYEYKF